MYRFSVVLPLVLALAACGGGSSNSGVSGGGGGGSGSPPGQMVPVTVGAGQTVTAVDITVAAPAASPAPNAQFLGTSSSAYVTGDVIHRGQQALVLVCGAGLAASMQARILGPTDVSVVGSVTGTTCNDSNGGSLSGVQVPIGVSSGASLGARTLQLQNTQNDITTFTGGLEVLP